MRSANRPPLTLLPSPDMTPPPTSPYQMGCVGGQVAGSIPADHNERQHARTARAEGHTERGDVRGERAGVGTAKGTANGI